MLRIHDEGVVVAVSGDDAPRACDDRIHHVRDDDEEDWGQGVSPCEQQQDLWEQFLARSS